MKHDIIKTENYLLVVDESEIKGWYYDAYIDKVKHSGGAEYGESIITRNIIAHLPLNGSPILKGVDLLPPLSLEEDVEKLALKHFHCWDVEQIENLGMTKAFNRWVDGYNKAKEKYKYTEEDLIKAIDMAFERGKNRIGFYSDYKKFIQSLSQPKMPIGFECVMEKDFRYNDDGEPFGFKVHNSDKITTTTTPEGHIQWVGTYIFN